MEPMGINMGFPGDPILKGDIDKISIHIHVSKDPRFRIPMRFIATSIWDHRMDPVFFFDHGRWADPASDL